MGDPLDFAVITALVLALTQALGPSIRDWLRPRALQVQSFGGGVALAYIFLSLFPEIDNAHPWLGGEQADQSDVEIVHIGPSG